MRIQQVLRKLKVNSAIHWIDLYPLGRVILLVSLIRICWIYRILHGKCGRTLFTHSLFLYQKSHSFAVLTRSISDTSITRVRKYRTPALSMKYSLCQLANSKSGPIHTRIRIFSKREIFRKIRIHT